MKKEIFSQDLNSLLKNICVNENDFYETANSNTKFLKNIFSSLDKDYIFLLVDYQKDEKLVDKGLVIGDLVKNPDYNYSFVPLGIIIEGEVIVNKGGKATKRLTEGDFIGLFETSDWLETGKRREIGDWTLIAGQNTQIVFFPSKFFTTDNKISQTFNNYLTELARNDRVPQPITDLPLLDWAASHTTKSRLSDYVIVVHTHLLPNSFPFFRQLAHLGNFGKIFIMEKPYSTVRQTFNNLIQAGCEVVQVQMEPGLPYEFSVKKSLDLLWAKVIDEQKKTSFKKLLIVDDGAELWLSIPWNDLKDVLIAGVEQTQRGITRIKNSNHHIPPIVSVASSGVKKIVESIFIGQSVVNKFNELGIFSQNKKIGIIGMGSIGSAVADYLSENNQESYFYDPLGREKVDTKAISYPSLDSLLNNCDIIIGTTGTDALKGIAFDRVHGQKILASASSTDVEFATLLKLAEPTTEPFGVRKVKVNENLEFDILNGGYPLNFDREKNATPDEDIVLTWCLMYIGAMQAVRLIDKKIRDGKIYDLDIISQEKILKKWIEEKIKLGQNPNILDDEIKRIINSTHLDGAGTIPSVWED